jgi:hypothetical protein
MLAATDDSILYRQILPNLPPSIQEIILNPPDLSNPSSLIPVAKAIWPYTRYIVVIAAFYIVWTTITSLLGYFSRLVRFGLRIGPILAVIAWVMGSSGQGNMSDLFELVKQWTGLSTGTQPNAPGIASLAGLFGGEQAKNGRKRQNPPRRGKATSQAAEPDLLSTLLKSATGAAGGDNWQGSVQDYVKNSLAKAAGLDWLFNQDETKHEK